jgi:hypothetical protein
MLWILPRTPGPDGSLAQPSASAKGEDKGG